MVSFFEEKIKKKNLKKIKTNIFVFPQIYFRDFVSIDHFLEKYSGFQLATE